MRDKKAAKLARQVNVDMGLSSPPDTIEKKYGNKIPKRGRDFLAIVDLINRDLRKIDPEIPRQVSPAHYAVVRKILEVALRDNMKLGEAYCSECKTFVVPNSKCPTCESNVEVRVPHDKLEKNSGAMLETMLDRMAPKLQAATTNINIHNTMINITGSIAQIITEYVPPEKRLDCGMKIRALIGSVKNAIGTEAAPC